MKMIMTVADAADREKWLAVRRQGIGGSDISAVLGMNKWKSAWELWAEKRGEREEPDLSDNEAVYWGTKLEDAVADRFTELTGKKCHRYGTVADDEYPFMHANVDRLITGEKAGLECKTANGRAEKYWDGDEVPTAYYLQCQWYMMVTGFPTWYIACLIGGQKFIWKEVPRNDEDIAAMRKAAIDFWDMVQTGRMPEVDGSDSCSDALRDKFTAEPGKEITLEDDEIEQILQLKEGVKNLENLIAEAENRIKVRMGEAEIGISENHMVTWKATKGRESINVKAIKGEMPEVWEKYKTTGKPGRTFRIY